MPKLQKKAITLQNVSHPKSRKAIKMFKDSKKKANREKSKMSTYMKQNLLGEKMLWFKERLPPSDPVCSKECANELICTYLARFDEELENIRLKHAIGQRKNRQHASREDLIRLTQEREREEYNTCGLEMPNLLDPLQVKMLRDWSGELRFIQNFTLCRLGKKHLQSQEVVSPTNGLEESSTQETQPGNSSSLKKFTKDKVGPEKSSKTTNRGSEMQVDA